ncbi:MAG: sugar phosphate isomerase/epimerase [Armatimonadetes bacterium]|nr:sugar phosphate isomerase/epimerase [Armatimonadota bacterium]
MTESWRNSMDVGIVHFMAFPASQDADYVIQSAEYLARDDFWDILEVRRSEKPGVHAKLKAIAEEAGMKLGLGAQPGLLGAKLSLNDQDEDGRKAAIDEVKKAIDAAYEMDCRICAVLTGKDPGNDEARKIELDLLVDSMKQVCQYSQDKAQNYVCWVSIETFDHETDKACLLGPTPRAAEVMERLKAEGISNTGLTLDLSHIPMLREDYADALMAAGDHLIHVHVGNCVCADPSQEGYGDYHPRFEYPGGENGTEELRQFLSALKYSGYFERDLPTAKPIVTVEVKPMPGETSEIVLAQTKRIWKRAWAGL